MDLTPYVENLRRELAVAAEAGGEEAVALAERLTLPLDSATRLTLLEALSAAAAEITSDLAPGSVDVRLRGRDPEFVVTAPPAEPLATETTADPPPGPAAQPTPEADDGATARLTLRLPEQLKPQVESAAGSAGISVNAWLVRAVVAALRTDTPVTHIPQRGIGQRYTGWVR